MFYALSAEATYNTISIGDRKFDTKEFGGRLELDLSPWLSTTTFIQWNNETNEVNANFRFHYIPKVGSDIYIVYNHLLDEENDYKTLQNAGILKINYTYRF